MDKDNQEDVKNDGNESPKAKTRTASEKPKKGPIKEELIEIVGSGPEKEVPLDELSTFQDGEKLSLVGVMLNLGKEYFKSNYAEKNRKDEAIDEFGEEAGVYYDSNPGFWIFGHGDVVDLPHEFSNPVLVSKFCSTLILIMMGCTAWRAIWMSIVVFVPSIHEYLYTNEVYRFPYFITMFFYYSMKVVTNSRKFRKYLYITPLNLLTIFIFELNFTALLCCIPLAVERGIQLWYQGLDLYNDIGNDGYDGKSPSYWKEMHLTPAFFGPLSAILVFLNLLVALCLDNYTTSRIGSAAMYHVMTVQTLITGILVLLLVNHLSYRAGPQIWDLFNAFFSSIWSGYASFIFVQYVDRVLHGKAIRLRGMRWTDVCYTALRICYL